MYQAHRSDTRTCTGDEDGFVEETRGVEEGHGAGGRTETAFTRCKLDLERPGQRLIAGSPTMTMHSNSNDDERDVEVRRWGRLLSWLEGHGMDLSPSAFHVERRPRSGILRPFHADAQD